MLFEFKINLINNIDYRYFQNNFFLLKMCYFISTNFGCCFINIVIPITKVYDLTTNQYIRMKRRCNNQTNLNDEDSE